MGGGGGGLQKGGAFWACFGGYVAQQTAATQLRMIIRCGSSSSEEIGKAN